MIFLFRETKEIEMEEGGRSIIGSTLTNYICD